MGRINVLDPNMVNMIAAGEVVERPASVIKELMENSIDAGATAITVEIEDGGRRLMRVTDNGMGMDEDDLVKAFMTHATSKIKSSDDLRAIATMGFRGEALASISSVAQIKAVTRTADSDAALCLEIDCGQSQPVVPTSADVGTSIQVRDLFYKLPARRKFLRTASTEFGHVSEQFIRIALGSCHSDEDQDEPVSPLQLTLIHNGREVHRLAAGQTLSQRLQALFPALWAESPDAMIGVCSQEKGVRLAGLLGKPTLARTSNKFQYVFLNGRFVRDKLITHAIKEAYRGLLEPNRFAVVFLYLDMPYEDYDVNVHPTKVEVRFYNGNLVHSQVLGVLREVLLRTDLNVEARLPEATDFGDAPRPVPPRGQRSEHIAQAMDDFFKTHRPSASTPRFDFKPAVPSAPMQVAESRPATYRQPVLETVESQASAPATPTQRRRFMQIHDSYLVAQTDEGFVIVDQHALHEKILYEKLTQRAQAGLESQRLLLPIPVELDAQQAAALEDQQQWLEQLGIELVQIGPKAQAIQSFPTLLQEADPAEFVRDLADLLVSDEAMDTEKITHAIFSMASCKAAIKAGNRLSDVEIEQLLVDGEAANSPTRCPHGRPTTIKFTLAQLEKQFLRT